MQWVQFVIFFLGVFGLWLWNRAESRSDCRHLEDKLAANDAKHAEALRILDAKHAQEMNKFYHEMNKFYQEMSRFKEIYAQETKDFHGRLCAIEERHKKSDSYGEI